MADQLYRGYAIPLTLNATAYADPRLAPGLDPALSPIPVYSSARTLLFRLEFADAAGVLSHGDPGTATIQVFRAKTTYTSATPVAPVYEWAEYVPERVLVPGQSERWDAVIPGAYSYRVLGVAGAVGTHYRLWVEEQA